VENFLRPLVAIEINKQILNPCHKTLEYEYNNCGILPVQDHENEIIFNLVIAGLGSCLKNYRDSITQSEISIF